MVWVTVFLISFLIANFLVPNILLVSLKRRLFDVPNKRSVHSVTSSRLGGVSFLPSVMVSICATMAVCRVCGIELSINDPQQFMVAIGAMMIMYTIGLFDDVVGLKYRVKFVAQFVASLLIVFSGMWIDNLHGFCGLYSVPAWVGMPFTVLLIMFVMNAVNLIDGIDGLASGLSMIALVVYGFMFICLDHMALSLFAFSMFGCLLAFFRYNVRGFAHKTLKIFMGDTGSLVTGTVLSICAIKLTQYSYGPRQGELPLLLAYSALIVPCFDVLRVMLSRKRRGKSMFLPDKTHIHHKFLELGFSARRSMCTILLISASFTAMNVFMYYMMNWLETIFIIDVVAFIVMNVFISKQVQKSRVEQVVVRD